MKTVAETMQSNAEAKIAFKERAMASQRQIDRERMQYDREVERERREGQKEKDREE